MSIACNFSTGTIIEKLIYMLLQYRQATTFDVPGIARVRSERWGTEEYWSTRILGYMNKTAHPQKALMERIVYVALEGETIVGFIAGHLTRRYDCDGELEWIDVEPEHRRAGVATALLKLLAAWFAEQGASRICIDVDPANAPAQSFYRRHGAVNLNEHWLVWENIGLVTEKENNQNY